MQIGFGTRKEYRSFIKKNGLFVFGKKNNKTRNNESKCSRSFFSIVVRLFRELKEKRFQLFFVIGLGFIANLLAAVFPWVGKYMIDYVFSQKNEFLLVISCFVLMIVAVMDVGINFFLDYKTSVISGNFAVHIKNRIMKHLQKLPLMKIQELKVGGIISRLQQDTETMSGLLFEAIVSPFNAGIMLIIALCSLFLISWKVTIIFTAFSFLIGGIGYFIFNIMMPFQKELREDNSKINSQLAEVFGGILVVRSFCKEQTVKREYGYNVGLLWRKTLYGNILGISVNRAVWFVFYLTQIFIWLSGGYSIINSKMSIGDLVVFISFIPFVFNPILNILASFSQLQQSLACADRTFDLLDEKIEVDISGTPFILNDIKRGIEFNDVTFDYPDGTRALKNISIKIPKGKITAFIGPSGGGKTTLINLISRFYEVTEGKITIDDTNIRDICLCNHRKKISLVLQEVFLFDGTIKENISYGNPKVKQNEIEKAAKIANCHDFIQKLKKQYDTEIGERGVRLSCGQKQRIALARALLTNPQILILDEATSNLDSESEALIQKSLKEIFKDRTSIIIAHRLSTILEADNIVVIEEGEVVEQGDFDELMKKKGRFVEMYNNQVKKKELEQNYWNSPNLSGERGSRGHS